MVKFIDLDEDALEDAPPHSGGKELTFQWDDDRPNPNFSLRLSVILSCYPIVSQFARYVDNNTLHELSRTCRQFRENLLQHRSLLIERTLRCINETANPARRLGQALHASWEHWTEYGRGGVNIGRISSGKLGACARDLVGDCRKCGRTVCRNCAVKAQPVSVLRNRHRRLCRTCMKCPLERLTKVTRLIVDEESNTQELELARGPCTCADVQWVCNPCGQALRTADTTYLRGWAWRTRYSACGGVGAGLGEGNEGVECGRYGDCLDAREVEKEIECDADELAALEAEMEKAEIDGRHLGGSSYMMHEIVGIGGKVKKKVKKMMPVGAIVKEYDDEKVAGKFLRREQEGANRSWCSWCARVVPGKKDVDPLGKVSAGSASSSSSVSST